jgi:hypothetical protein
MRLAFVAAQPYPGVTVDSGEYLATADGVASGHGLSMQYVGYDEAFRVLKAGERIPLTQFPPGCSPASSWSRPSSCGCRFEGLRGPTTFQGSASCTNGAAP